MSKRKRKRGPQASEASGSSGASSSSSSLRSVQPQQAAPSPGSVPPTVEMTALTDVHKAFLQRLMASLVLSKSACEKLLKECFKDFKAPQPSIVDPENPEAEDGLEQPTLDRAVWDINLHLRRFGFQIKSRRDDGYGKRMYAFVNTMDDGALPGTYEKKTVKVFEEIIKACIGADKGELSNDDDFHTIRYELTLDITRQEMKKIIRTLCCDKWLMRTDSIYKIGPRTYVECDSFLEKCGARRSKDGAIVIRDKATWNWNI